MAQAEARGVQHHARRGGGVAAVPAVAEDRHPRFREVNADLVLAPRARMRLHEQTALQHFDDHEVRDGGP
jgi:hypothetical protein